MCARELSHNNIQVEEQPRKFSEREVFEMTERKKSTRWLSLKAWQILCMTRDTFVSNYWRWSAATAYFRKSFLMRNFRMSLLLPFIPLLAVIGAAILTPAVRRVRANTMENYIVLYKQELVPYNAATTITNAGGTLLKSYDQIGVVIARSDSTSFRDNLLNDSRIENVAPTTSFGVKLKNDAAVINTAEGLPIGDLPNEPASDNDNLSALQWDMIQIHTPEAHQITGGSPAVVVGNIDTGIDKNHPDLQPNLDFANSCS